MVIREFSTGTGQVMMSVEADEGGLNSRWRERGGPEVSRPLEEGFGMVLIRGQIMGERGGVRDITLFPERPA